MGILPGMIRTLLFFICFLSLSLHEVIGKDFMVKTKNNSYVIKTRKNNNIKRTKESGSDYHHGSPHDNDPHYNFPDSVLTVINITKAEEGEDVALKCESTKEFQDCKFKDPTGKIYKIGVGGGSSYFKSRVDCLCTEEEYDPTMVCGVYIKKVTKSDAGEWSCIMEFEENGKPVEKVVPKCLQVGREKVCSDPYDKIIGGFTPELGVFVAKYGEPQDVKPNQLVKVLESMGSEYKIKFQLKVTKLGKTEKPYNILLFTADKGLIDKNYMKEGDRNPGVSVLGNELLINADVGGNRNYLTKVPLTVGQWMKIEICQHIIDNKLMYEVKINHQTIVTKEQTKPCLFKGMKVFAGKAGSEYGRVKAQIRALFFSTDDKTNGGKCFVDFRPAQNIDPHVSLIDNKKPDVNGSDGKGPGGSDPDGNDPDGNDPDGNGQGGTGTGGNGPNGNDPDGTRPPQLPGGQCVAKSQPNELCLKMNQLIQVVPVIGREYTIQFELYLYSYPTNPLSSVLHFTTSGNLNSYGDRNPAVWVTGKGGRHDNGAKDLFKKIIVSASLSGDVSQQVYTENTYPLKTWIPIKISQKLNGDKFLFTVKINDIPVISTTNNLPAEYTDVKVYGGNPWYPAPDGKIRNLFVKSEKDGICVCKAKSDVCEKRNTYPYDV